MVLASLAFLFLLDWEDLSLKHSDNPSLLEARSILTGQIALSERAHDTVMHQGRTVNVFQPGQTLFFLAHLLVVGENILSVFQIELYLVFVLSALLFGLALLKLSQGRTVLSLSLGMSVMLGAPYIASLRLALVGSMYRVNHCLSILFVLCLLVLLESKDTRRRLFLIGVCVGAATLFRAQNVILLVLPLSYLLQDSEGQSWQVAGATSTPEARRALAHRVLKLAIFPALAIAVIAGFQMARFGNPLETGYARLYDGRDDYVALRAHSHGLFSLHFLPENLYRLICALPRFELDGWRIDKIVGDPRGNSLLFSQPILLIIVFLWRGLRSSRAQSYFVVSFLLAAPVLLYHNPGYYAPGYNRLSLDYLPLWVASIAVFARYGSEPRYLHWIAIGLSTLAVAYGVAMLVIGVSTG